jgi:hypothetical protein
MFSTSERRTQTLSSKSSIQTPASNFLGRSSENLQFNSRSLKISSRASNSQERQRQASSSRVLATFTGGEILRYNDYSGFTDRALNATINGLEDSQPGGKWVFYNNGRFTFSPRDGSTLMRTSLKGDYTSTTRSFSFQGSGSYSVPGAFVNTTINGKFVRSYGRIFAGVIRRNVKSFGQFTFSNLSPQQGAQYTAQQDNSILFSMKMIRTS